MKCPVCGAAELIHDTRDQTYTFNSKTFVIKAVTGDFCPACDECITDMAESKRVMQEMHTIRGTVPLGKIKCFGPSGPKYEVGQPLRQLEDGDWVVEITLIETGEKTEYRLTRITDDPEAY